MAFFVPMKNATITSLLILIATIGLSNTFKVKIEVELVNHASIQGTTITIKEKGDDIQTINLKSDNSVKVELEKGKLFEIWINKDGYLPHVIHNVHAEGQSKFDVVLFKATKKITPSSEAYRGMNRDYVDVKKMTIPAEYLNDGVEMLKKESMTKVEIQNLKAVEKLGKAQLKAQKKIDKLSKKRDKLDAKITDVKADMDSGESSKIEGDEEILKLQKKVVKLNKKLEKLAY
ncbi:MAG: hypothetical protein Salg2KO_22560 [Salibacteraceae bacterium]